MKELKMDRWEKLELRESSGIWSSEIMPGSSCKVFAEC